MLHVSSNSKCKSKHETKYVRWNINEKPNAMDFKAFSNIKSFNGKNLSEVGKNATHGQSN